MKPVILIISSVLSAFVFCENKIFETQITEHSYTTDDNLKKLLGTCFLNHTNPIISDKKFTDIMNKALEESELSPSFMLINEDFHSKPPKPLFLPAYPSYILPGDSPQKLKSILEQLKASQWWSIESIFMAVDLETNSRKNSQTSLQVLWEMNLFSFYMCTKNDLMIYMFNPFTNTAPKSWAEVKIGNKESDDRGHSTANHIRKVTLSTILITKLNNRSEGFGFIDHEFCESLFFDKTKKLGGYKINFVTTSLPNRKWVPNKVYNMTTIQHKLHQLLFEEFIIFVSYMNVTPLVYFDFPGENCIQKNLHSQKRVIV